MSATGTQGKKKKSPKPRFLVSRSTILILSGVLIGLGFGNGFTPSFQYLGPGAGWVGLISYVGLEMLARHRRERAAQRKMERTATTLASRIYRHIPRVTLQPAGPPLGESPRQDVSLMTVPSAKRSL